jgi:hypothetical protein
MSSDKNMAAAAARAFAKRFALPSSRGSVFVWNDENGVRIVVTADQRWLAEHRNLPATYEGYPVVIEDQWRAVAH